MIIPNLMRKRIITPSSPSLPTWTNYNDGSGLTSGETDFIFDLTQDINSVAPNLLKIIAPAGETVYRAGAAIHIPGGGFYGNGCMRFIPHYTSDTPGGSEGQGYCGIGFAIPAASQSAYITFGRLVTFTSDLLAIPWKDVIFIRQDGQTNLGRPMIITKTGEDNGLVFSPCDDTECNCTSNLTDNAYYPPNGQQPNMRIYAGVRFWIELSVDAITGRIYVRFWDEYGVFNGYTLEQDMLDSGTGGLMTALDTTGFFDPYASAGAYEEVELIRLRTGTSAAITPPPGFYGSNSSNWVF